MKRKLSELPEGEKEAKRRELDLFQNSAPDSPLPPSILSCAMKRIDHAFDVALSRRSPMDVSVEFEMLQEVARFVLFIPAQTANLQPSTRLSTRYSTLALSTVVELRIQWLITEMAIAEEMFGDRFRERKYADASGWLKFDPSVDAVTGGLIQPVIDGDAPLRVTYDWDTQHCKSNFLTVFFLDAHSQQYHISSL
jgi:hypothetical protein